jgi:hypothetical protein
LGAEAPPQGCNTGAYARGVRLEKEVQAQAAQVERIGNRLIEMGASDFLKARLRTEENTAADRVELTVEQVERLNHLMPAAGERHDEGNMAVIDR